MFAHILTTVTDDTLVKTKWEKLTEESMDNYSVIRTSLSELATTKETLPFIASDVGQTLERGRSDGKLLWIQADANITSLSTEIQRCIARNTVFINKDSVC